jgi:hypothetical protein
LGAPRPNVLKKFEVEDVTFGCAIPPPNEARRGKAGATMTAIPGLAAYVADYYVKSCGNMTEALA